MASLAIQLATQTTFDISEGALVNDVPGYWLTVGRSDPMFVPKDQADDIARLILFGEVPPSTDEEPQPETPEEAPE